MIVFCDHRDLVGTGLFQISDFDRIIDIIFKIAFVICIEFVFVLVDLPAVFVFNIDPVVISIRIIIRIPRQDTVRRNNGILDLTRNYGRCGRIVVERCSAPFCQRNSVVVFNNH